ncbi:fasciclin domain family [Ceratocystis lukuohia]|uniref:Fasciclin domain family n=1 Tax=Ceratocystis lukuohia TaxID=2019550 RepID=A0ABR4MIY8_9PEZI
MLKTLPFEGVSAAVLLDAEIHRRGTSTHADSTPGSSHSHNLAKFRLGCPDIDDHVLLGGIEPGSVLGISAEEDSMGLQLAMQVLAQRLVATPRQTALVASTLPVATVARTLRDVLVGMQGRKAEWRAVLARVSISRVFDFQGLWEVIGDVDAAEQAQRENGSDKEIDPGRWPSDKASGSVVKSQKDVVPDIGPLPHTQQGTPIAVQSPWAEPAKTEAPTPAVSGTNHGLNATQEAGLTALEHRKATYRPSSMEIPNSDEDDDEDDDRHMAFQFHSDLALAEQNNSDTKANAGSSVCQLPESTPSTQPPPQKPHAKALGTRSLRSRSISGCFAFPSKVIANSDCPIANCATACSLSYISY